MEPEALNKFMLKVKPTYDLVTPDFQEWLDSGALDVPSVELLKQLAEINTIGQSEFVNENDAICKILLNATYAAGPGLLRNYALERLCDICRVNNAIYSRLLHILSDRDVFEIYYDIATHEKDPKIVEKILFLLAGLIIAGKERFTREQVEKLLAGIDKAAIDDAAKLYAIANVLKGEEYRKMVFECEFIMRIIKRGLDKEALPNAQYKAVYCLWLLTRHQENIQVLFDKGILDVFCDLFCSTKIEKIVRVGLLVLKSLFDNQKCLELMVERNVAQTLTLLEYDKWRDLELYDNIHQTHAILECRTCKLRLVCLVYFLFLAILNATARN
ncbi:bifunctional ATPase [Babesia duncani]|uniref:Bifunctional ATPase n=1 Tax=Babesia duncani TaxID=323732 RepID=A0AAD9UQK6_9APIC|nr:bifunctional ATPase [Babesia duncani]